MPASHEREQAIFTLAVAKPATERAAFLDRECAGDLALRQRLEALMAAHERPNPVLDAQNQPVLDPQGQTVLAPITSIERYRRTLLLAQFHDTPAQIRKLGRLVVQSRSSRADTHIALEASGSRKTRSRCGPWTRSSTRAPDARARVTV